VAAHWQSQVLSYFGLFEQNARPSRAAWWTRARCFLRQPDFFFLFLTLRVVESRRWK